MALKRTCLEDLTKRKLQEAGLPMVSERSEPLKVRNIRMADSDWDALKRHFRKKGISLSSGVRMVLREYLENSE